LSLLSKKTVVADGSMRCGQSYISRMLEGKACIDIVDVTVWRPAARRWVDVVLSDSIRSYSKGEVAGM
jgi:hypothetical protein